MLHHRCLLPVPATVLGVDCKPTLQFGAGKGECEVVVVWPVMWLTFILSPVWIVQGGEDRAEPFVRDLQSPYADPVSRRSVQYRHILSQIDEVTRCDQARVIFGEAPLRLHRK